MLVSASSLCFLSYMLDYQAIGRGLGPILLSCSAQQFRFPFDRQKQHWSTAGQERSILLPQLSWGGT